MDICHRHCPSGRCRQNPDERAGVSAVQSSAGEETSGFMAGIHATCSSSHCWTCPLFAWPPLQHREDRVEVSDQAIAGSSLQAAMSAC